MDLLWLRISILITGLMAIGLGIKLRWELRKDELVKARVFLRYLRYALSFIPLIAIISGISVYLIIALIQAEPDWLIQASPPIIAGIFVAASVAYIATAVLGALR